MVLSLIEQITTSTTSQAIISIAVMLLLGFAMTRLTKLVKLPNVSAYIITGILIGPYVLDLIPKHFITNTSFLADIALAFISFASGEFLMVEDFKKTGVKCIIICVIESVLSFVLVFILCRFIFKIESMPFCLLLSSLAIATAPASTMMTIRQTGAKGPFVNTLLQVIALDNVLALIAYSIAIQICKAEVSETSVEFLSILKTVGINIGIAIIGGLFGFVLKFLMPKKRTTDNRLIIIIAILFSFCGICACFGQSPLLGCMAMAIVYINVTKDTKLFRQLNYFSPPIMLLFFVRSGISVNLGSFASKAAVGIAPLIVVSMSYAVVRMIGKAGGSFVGGVVTKSDPNVKKYLGMGLVPQSGVAIGLAVIGAREIGGELGPIFETIILSSSILYELVGPALAKLALYLSKSYSTDIEEIAPVSETNEKGEQKTEVEILIDRINKIKKEIPEHDPISEDEAAFNEAAYEQSIDHRPGMLNRRR